MPSKQHWPSATKFDLPDKFSSVTMTSAKQNRSGRPGKGAGLGHEITPEDDGDVSEEDRGGTGNKAANGAKYDDDNDEIFDFASVLVPTKHAKSATQPKGLLPRNNRGALRGNTESMESEEDDEDAQLLAKQLQAANRKKKKSGGFQSMGLSYPVYKAVISKGFKVPTPIQRKCIPVALEGKDLVGMARTGSGKTAAFMIPLIERLKAHSAKVGVRGIVLSPSRELAMQTHKFTKEMTKHTDLRSCVVVGGDNMEDQFSMIASNPDILIATPGRLMHLIVEMELDLHIVEVIVFDEADRLFEMGFAVQLHEILHKLPPSRQTMLFSATLPSALVDFAKAGLQDPTLIRLDVDTKISKDLKMAFFVVKSDEKEASLLCLLRDVLKVPKIPAAIRDLPKESGTGKGKVRKKRPSSGPSEVPASDHQTIVFVATKHHVEYVGALLEHAGYHCSMIYGAMDQTARKVHISNFRDGRTNVLVVTDVAARGIDIPILENVVNYDFVDTNKIFVHRVGRTARAGRRGWAYSLLTAEDLPYLLDLQLFLDRPLVLGRSSNSTASYVTDITLGALPRGTVELDMEWIKDLLWSKPDVDALRTVADNGRRLYSKSKPNAAPESYKRAKELAQKKPLWEVHPLFGGDDVQKEVERSDFLASLSNFRPAETVFEVGSKGAKKSSVASSVMKQRREAVGSRIVSSKKGNAGNEDVAASGDVDEPSPKPGYLGQAGEDEIAAAFGSRAGKKRKAGASPSSEAKRKTVERNFRDEEFYISHYQPNANTEKGYSITKSGSFLEQAQNAMLDLTGDDRRSGMRWDAKKKKFVIGDGTGSDNKKLIRTESGAKVSATFKSGRYKEWQSRTRTSVPRTGEPEDPSAVMAPRRFRHSSISAARPLDPLRRDYVRKKRRLDRRMAESGDLEDGVGAATAAAKGGRGRIPTLRGELKTTAQIAKERLAKAKRRQKTGRLPRKPAKKRR